MKMVKEESRLDVTLFEGIVVRFGFWGIFFFFFFSFRKVFGYDWIGREIS